MIQQYPARVRASRLVGLLGLLQARGRMSAAQLAGELEVSERTILRDIDALGAAGIPVYAVRGCQGGFELLDGFRSDLPLRRSGPVRPAPVKPVAAGTGVQQARIRLSPRGRRLAVLLGRPAGLRIRHGASPPPDGQAGWSEARIRVGSLDAAVPDLLVLGAEVEVIDPPALRARLAAAARQIAIRHAGDGSGPAGGSMISSLTRDGVRLVYETAGAGEPPIVFVHGWCCDRSYFAPQFAHFAGQQAVAALDLRGHGESGRGEPGADDYRIETLADDVLAVTEAAGFSQPVLAGHSLGALVGLACATRPGAIRALLMIDPAPITNAAAKAFFLRSVAAVAADHDGSWRRSFVASMFLPGDRARRAAILSGMGQAPTDVAAGLMRAMGEFDAAAALAAAAVPVLSIGSAVPANKSADLRALSPSIVIGQTVGSGHFLQLEVPEQVNAMIERFLAITSQS
jgi:pimeloyl-ACP methyl ester carboxylesterase/biotin operon repressor